MSFDILSEDDREFILDKLLDDYSEDEVVYLFSKQRETPASESTIRNFMGSDEAQKELELRRSIADKRSQMTREEVIRDLRDMKDVLQDKVHDLKDSKHGRTFNEAISNLRSVIESLAKLIGELENVEQPDNVIYVNNSENYIVEEVNSVINYLPEDDKRRIVRDLTEDIGLKVVEE